MRRKICIFTAARAEYGLLKPLMEEIRKDRDLRLQLLVSGAHLSSEFGMTVNYIGKDGYSIDKKVKIPLKTEKPNGLAKSMSEGIDRFTAAFNELKPDIVVIMGDRFESFAAATACMISRIPIAHIHGGESTFGSMDEAMRHSITKMSHLHFASAEKYQKRIIQLGEDPSRVFDVGAIGLDNLKALKPLSKLALERELEFEFRKRNLLITYHPVTLEDGTAEKHFSALLNALDDIRDTGLIFTKANADSGGRVINRMIDRYVSENIHKAAAFASLGQLKYLSLMRYADGVVGNSSSGIIEAPSFKIGTVNIGDRQCGRIRARSVIDCMPEAKSIRDAIRKLYSKKFQDSLAGVVNPYGFGGSAPKIKAVLKKYRLDRDILKKRFYDLKVK